MWRLVEGEGPVSGVSSSGLHAAARSATAGTSAHSRRPADGTAVGVSLTPWHY